MDNNHTSLPKAAALKKKIEERLFDPDRVYDNVMHPDITPEVAAAITVRVYSSVHAPLAHQSHDRWVEMFTKGGMTAGTPDPTQPVTLYRGCAPEHKEGMSWTRSLVVAAGYARTRGGNHIYFLHTTWPEIIFHVEAPEGFPSKKMDECVIDARGQDIQWLDPDVYRIVADKDTGELMPRTHRFYDDPLKHAGPDLSAIINAIGGV